MNKKEITKRYMVLLFGLFFTALGIAVSKYSELGVSTISSVPSVVSYKFEFITFGTWSMIWNFILIAGQIIILRKNFRAIQFLQIPVSFIFGYFIDLCSWIVSPIQVSTYPTQLLMVIIGIIVLGFGVSLTFLSDVVMNPGEGIVKAVSDVYNINLGNAKTLVDILCVFSAVLLSLSFFSMKLIGVREGTLFAALFTGTVVKYFNKLLQKPLKKYYGQES